MHVAVGDHFGTVVHQRHHHQVSAARIHLLARAQRLVDDQCTGSSHRHLTHHFMDDLAHHLLHRRGVDTAGGAGVGGCQQAGGQRRFHLRGTAATHGQRHHAVRAQQEDEGGEVDSLVGLGHRGQIHQHRVLLEEVRGVAQAGL